VEKVGSVFSFQDMGNLKINPFGEKPSFISRTLENKVNYFVTVDHENGMPGTPPIPTFCYYPIKTEVIGGRLFLRKFPGLLSDGIIMMARKKAIEVNIDEVSRGRVILGNRVEEFATLAERYATMVVEAPVAEPVVDPLAEVDLYTYTTNPQAYWL